MVLQRYRYFYFIISSLQKLLFSVIYIRPQSISRALCHRFLSFNFHLIYTMRSETRASSSLSNIKHSTPPISVCASRRGNSLLILSPADSTIKVMTIFITRDPALCITPVLFSRLAACSSSTFLWYTWIV